MAIVEPIRRTKIYQEIAKRLEAQILDGHLRPGDSLPSERELMSVYQVGRPAVREALLSLQKSGLIAISTGERARVIQPSASILVDELGSAARYLLNTEAGVREFQQARAFFETALARHAALHATAEDLVRLEEALAANEKAIDDQAEFARSDVTFHFVIAQIPRNSLFSALHSAMIVWLTEQRSTSLQVAGAREAAVASHRAIFEAIRRKDADAAETAMKTHLAQVEAEYWQAKRNQAASRKA